MPFELSQEIETFLFDPYTYLYTHPHYLSPTSLPYPPNDHTTAKVCKGEHFVGSGVRTKPSHEKFETTKEILDPSTSLGLLIFGAI